jgi:hypothetical protein
MIFFVVYLILYVVIRWANPDGIIFYQGLNLLYIGGLMWIPLQRLYAGKWFSKDLAIGVLLAYCFLITFPALWDRSISHYMIGQAAHGGVTLRELNEGVKEEYFKHAVAKRVDEQMAGSLFSEEDGLYELTRLGRTAYYINRAGTAIFKIDPFYVSGGMHEKD